jgi:hypothetical protein
MAPAVASRVIGTQIRVHATEQRLELRAERVVTFGAAQGALRTADLAVHGGSARHAADSRPRVSEISLS